MVLFGLLHTINLLKSVCKTNKAECLLLMSNTCTIFAGIWITREVVQKMHLWMEGFSTMSYVLDELVREISMFERLKKFSSEYYRKSVVTSCLILLRYLTFVIICVRSVSQNDIKYVVPEITIMVVTSMQITIFMIVTAIASVIKAILELAGIHFCQQMKIGNNLTGCIERYKKYIWISSYTWKNLYKTINSSVVICLICSVTIMILNVYCVIIELNSKSAEKLFISWTRTVSIGPIVMNTILALDQDQMVSTLQCNPS